MARLGHLASAMAVFITVSACATTPAQKTNETASATLATTEGKALGSVALTQLSDGVLVKTSISGMQPGSYGFHLHTVGVCEAPAFATAGGHWNPTAHKHGKDSPEGPHMGDLPNIAVGADGNGTIEYKIAGAMLAGGDHPLLDADGASAMLHAGPDDYKSDPAGNSGARIACGVVSLSK